MKEIVETLVGIGHRELKKNGIFVLPGFAKFVVVKKPARPAREGINPFTKEKQMFAAKPASKAVKARAVKAIKDAVAESARPSLASRDVPTAAPRRRRGQSSSMGLACRLRAPRLSCGGGGGRSRRRRLWLRWPGLGAAERRWAQPQAPRGGGGRRRGGAGRRTPGVRSSARAS